MPKPYRVEYGIGIKTIDLYKKSIGNSDPDIILFDDDLDEEYIKDIAGDRVTQKISIFIDNFNSGYLRKRLEIEKILTSIIKSEFKFQRIDDLKVSIPRILKDNVFLKSFLGSCRKASSFDHS